LIINARLYDFIKKKEKKEREEETGRDKRNIDS